MTARRQLATGQTAAPCTLAAPGATGARKTATGTPERSKPRERKKSALEEHLLLSIRLRGLPEPVCEHRFHESRMWRIDLAWLEERLAVEIEGGIYRGGGHTSVAGIKRDIEKANALTLLGWRLLRFHGDQVKSGEAVELIRQALTAERGPNRSMR